MNDSAKLFLWVVIIAIGVFAGIFAYKKYTEYRLVKAMEIGISEFNRSMESFGKSQKAANQKQKLASQARERERQRKVDEQVYKDTACAINTDTQSCSCISMKTGARVVIEQKDCARRAAEISR